MTYCIYKTTTHIFVAMKETINMWKEMDVPFEVFNIELFKF
jgi:hypothetical protein